MSTGEWQQQKQQQVDVSRSRAVCSVLNQHNETRTVCCSSCALRLRTFLQVSHPATPSVVDTRATSCSCSGGGECFEACWFGRQCAGTWDCR